MTPILCMPSDRTRGVRNRRNLHRSREIRVPAPATASAPAPSGRHRLDPGAAAPEPRAMKWEGRAVVLGCLAWYLVVFALLVFFANWSARRSAEVIGPPIERARAVVSPPD